MCACVCAGTRASGVRSRVHLHVVPVPGPAMPSWAAWGRSWLGIREEVARGRVHVSEPMFAGLWEDSDRTRRRCWVWPPVPGDTRGWRPSSFCGAELRPRQVRASPLASGHSLGPSPGRGLSGPSEPGCPSSRPSVRPEGTAALKKSALTCVLHCCCRYLGDGPAGCATRRTSAESARGFPAWEPRLQSRTGAPREAGALAWGRAACWWQFEEPTARFVPPRVRGPVRVP